MSKSIKPTGDWKSQLGQLKNELAAAMTPEEKQQQKLEEDEKTNRIIKWNQIKSRVYEFLAGYKHNSGIFVNNFFRNRSYELYCEDKFHDFDFDVTGIMPANLFDDMAMSMQMVQYLSKMEEIHNAYFPINASFIERLIALAEALDTLEPLQEDLLLYRGCSTIERNGVNGIVSTTTDKKITEQFSRGTILTINVPRGTKCLNVRSIRPKKQQRDDFENEVLLPPCNYEIISSQVQNNSYGQPNNHNNKTLLLEIAVQPLDLLEEFLKRLENPPKEYVPVYQIQGRQYDEAVAILKNYITRRNKNNCQYQYTLQGAKKAKISIS